MLQSGQHQTGEVENSSVQTPKVLIVDDNEQLLNVLQMILESRGYEVISCGNAEQALNYVKDNIPDLIVSDIMMPGLNGFGLHSEIQKDPRLCDVPFLFLTALSDPLEVRAGKEAGVDEYLTKPFSPDDLVSAIRGKLSLAGRRRMMHGSALESYRRRIIHTLSHEFRTPLVSINTGTELLLDHEGGMDEAHTQRLLVCIRRGGQRLQRLVDDFMLLQQIDWGHADSMYARFSQPVSARRIVETAIEHFVASCEDYGDHITADLEIADDAEKLSVNVYDVQVIDVVHRLLSNAVKFAGPDKPIRIVLSRDENSINITVRDRGPGLSPDRLKEACEIFSQIGRDKFEQQGCGLGLTIASYFAELNGGTLKFDRPDDGPGLSVTFSLPVAAEAAKLAE